jgi:hypothetical protein
MNLNLFLAMLGGLRMLLATACFGVAWIAGWIGVESGRILWRDLSRREREIMCGLYRAG